MPPIVQPPDASAVPVPSTVTPSVSRSVTAAPASAPVPVNVGVATLVTSSLCEAPLSDAAVRTGAPGAAAEVSIVITNPAEATLVLPAISVWTAVIVWLPAPGAALLTVQLPEPSAMPVPSTVVPLVSSNVTVAPASAPDPVKVGVVMLVILSVCDGPLSDAAVRSGALTAAAVVSIVTTSAAEATLMLPAISV